MPKTGRPPKDTWEKCKAAGCSKEARAGKGFCQTHYMGARRGHLDWETGAVVQPPKRVASYGPGARCLVQDCGSRPYSNGLCSLHYQRWRKGTNVGVEVPVYNQQKSVGVYTQTATCIVGGCDRRPVNRWMCDRHAQQRVAGIIDAQGNQLRPFLPWKNKRKEGPIKDGAGYLLVFPPPEYKGKTRDGRVLEHRLVMAQHLGRLLEDWELVHHKDGDRENNKLSNLELLDGRASASSEPHPPGHEFDARTAAQILLQQDNLSPKLRALLARELEKSSS